MTYIYVPTGANEGEKANEKTLKDRPIACFFISLSLNGILGILVKEDNQM